MNIKQLRSSLAACIVATNVEAAPGAGPWPRLALH
jgi:hypothetical protein